MQTYSLLETEIQLLEKKKVKLLSEIERITNMRAQAAPSSPAASTLNADIARLEREKERLIEENDRILQARADEMRTIGKQVLEGKALLASLTKELTAKKEELKDLSH